MTIAKICRIFVCLRSDKVSRPATAKVKLSLLSVTKNTCELAYFTNYGQVCHESWPMINFKIYNKNRKFIL